MRETITKLLILTLSFFLQVLWRIDPEAEKSALAILAKRMPPSSRRVKGLDGEAEKSALAILAKRITPSSLYMESLHALGILNYTNADVTGERHFLTWYLRQIPTPIVFDVGANKGGYSKLVLKLSPEAIVHAFEPNPITFEILSEVGAPGLYLHHVALGEEPGLITLFDYEGQDASEHASVYRDVFEFIHKKAATAHNVKCETIDNITETLNIDRIDLLKIDTEGHELAVLKGAKSLIDSGRISAIQFEFNEMNVISRTFFRDYVELLPTYRFFRLLPDGLLPLATYRPIDCEIFAFQNILCLHKKFSSILTDVILS